MPRALRCPYWDHNCETAPALLCEACIMMCPDMEARVEYICLYCASAIGWKRCSLAQMLERYYERIDTLGGPGKNPGIDDEN